MTEGLSSPFCITALNDSIMRSLDLLENLNPKLREDIDIIEQSICQHPYHAEFLSLISQSNTSDPSPMEDFGKDIGFYLDYMRAESIFDLDMQ